MSWGGPEFIIAIIAVCYGGWIINNYIRARHGYALEDEWGGKTERNDHAVGELKAENQELRRRLARLEERAAAIETIVTDSGFETARQIGALERTASGKSAPAAN
ncbi:hypothetical protein [Novosphingobium aquimarinum]|uniref:hypothetical protein n=1 Tax=Novosphingobium aquimarinum TaxID=2682494 RepID=UPI0012EBE6D3|nr:hypothetical protein [Novosphingobium aquimarinum]